MIRILLILIALLACVRANDAGGGAPGVGANVTLTTTATTATLSNGVIQAVIEKSTGRVTSYKLNGFQMVDPANPIYYSMDGGADFDVPSGCVYSLISSSSDHVEISCKRTWNASAGYRHNFDIDLRYVLRRGDTGLYAFAILDHPASYPAASVGEWRIVWKLPRNSTTFTFERAYVDDLRNWEMPSVFDYQNSSPTAIGEIVKLNTGLWAGKYDCKYMYSARYSEIGTWGHASHIAKKGVWFVLGGHDYFNDGPTKQDLTSSESYILMHFGRNHYGGSATFVEAGETWRKIYGPFLLYCNATTATTNAGDVLWADAKAQVAAEKAAWPYSWLTNPDHPAASPRGTVTGRLLVNDPLKPSITGANANIGLAAPEETNGTWQFQSKGYQYWTKADASGNFSIPAIRPGTYTLYAFTDGVVGEFSKIGVTVTAGGTNAQGDITWNVSHPGTSIAWEIGVPDRTAKEFKHGNDYFIPFMWDVYTQERPRLSVDFAFQSLPLVNPGTITTAGLDIPLVPNTTVASAASVLWSLVSGPGTATFSNAASPSTSITFSAAGNYVLRLTGTNALGDASRDLAVTVTAATPGFAAWQATNWSGVTDALIIGPNADPDGDGVNNSVEFQAGTDPTSAASVPTFVWSRLSSGGWSNGGSWNLGVPPTSNAATKIEFFTGLEPGGTIAANNDIGGNFTLQRLALNGRGNGSTSLTGGSLSFTNGATFDINSGGIAYSLASPITLGGTLNVGGTSNDTVTVTGTLGGNGTLTMRGAGVLDISGPHTASGSVAVNAGTLRVSGASTTTASFSVIGGTLSISGSGSVAPAAGASLTLGGSARGTMNYNSSGTSRFGSISVGNGNDGAGNSVFNQTNGTINATALTLNNGFTGGGAGDFNLSGGLLSVSGAATISNQVAGDNVWSTLTVSGTGALAVNGGLRLTGAPAAGRNAAGRVTQNGGTVAVAGGLNIARTTATNTAARRGEYNLNGGVLNVNQITQDTGTDTFGTFNFNGGILKPTASSLTFMQGLTAAQIKTGGARIDTNGVDITIAQPLLTGGAGDGGLTKSGLGTLTLASANTYSGTTTITAGKLALSGSSKSNIAVNSGTLAAIGTPSTTGNVTIATGGRFEIRPGSDTFAIGGSVTLAGALDVTAAPGIISGTTFTIVTKTSAGAVSGSFSGKPQGSVFPASGYHWLISYTGGDGNDVTLTIVTAQQAWRYTHFGTTAGTGTASDTFDADADGEINLMEFATAQSPNAATLTQPALVRNGATLEFTYTRATASVKDGVTFGVEWSDTLGSGSWRSTGVTEQVLSDDGNVQQVRATLPGGTGKRFVRVRVRKI